MLLRAIRLPAILASTVLAGGLLLTAPSLAGTATSNLEVTATVAANCTITTSAVAFGSYDPIGTNKTAALDNTGSVTVTCTNGSAVTVTLGQGANAAATSTDAAPLRRLKDAGTNHLAYSLFSDAARTVVWGNTTATGKADTGTGLASLLTVYGRVPQDQNVPTGSYSDTVVATVTF